MKELIQNLLLLKLKHQTRYIELMLYFGQKKDEISKLYYQIMFAISDNNTQKTIELTQVLKGKTK